MHEFEKYQVAQGGLNPALGQVYPGFPASQPQQINPEELAKLEAEQIARAAQHERYEALRLAFEMTRGTDVATDHQAIIRAARELLEFIRNG
jgi:hypothetical protein